MTRAPSSCVSIRHLRSDRTLVLFPGFIGLKVLEAITDHRRRTEFDKLGVVVGFSLLTYMVYYGIALGFGLPQVPAGYEAHSFEINGWSVLAIGLLALALPTTVGIFINRGWLTRVNYRNWIANRDVGGPASVWVGSFSDYADKWVRIHLEDDSVIEGAIEWFSDDGDEHEVFLGAASIRPSNGDWTTVKGPGVLIGRSASVLFAEFLDGEEDDP